MTLTIPQLESALGEPDRLTTPDLPAIRRAGTRRRRARRAALAAGGVLSVSVLTGAGFAVLNHRDAPPAGLPLASVVPHNVDPATLSPLARRVLHEVPGARQVSDDVVLIPGRGRNPDGPTPDVTMTAGMSLPAKAVAGVTAYARQDMPGWLYDEILRREQAAADPDGSYSSGGIVDGVGVDQGPATLGCAVVPEWQSSQACDVSFLFKTADGWNRAWGMGTDSFLKPGHGMELFSSPQFTEGRPTTLWIGGLDGTDIASVDFVLADRTRVEGTVAPGTISEGDTLFWALVPGDLTDVVARDADGNVIEDHQVKPCSSPVECEVR